MIHEQSLFADSWGRQRLKEIIEQTASVSGEHHRWPELWTYRRKVQVAAPALSLSSSGTLLHQG